jgi:hypothetical protein
VRNSKHNKDMEMKENLQNKIQMKHELAGKKREKKLEAIKAVALLAEKGKPIAHLGSLNEPPAAAPIPAHEEKQI